MLRPDEKEILETAVAALPLTAEQEAILCSTGNLVINAVAGSGKTTTIIQYAATRPKGSRILYLAYNRSVKLEAQRRFAAQNLHNVRVETAHSLAYRPIVPGSGYTVRQQEYKTYEIAEMLGLQGTGQKHGEYILASHIQKFVAFFCNSAAKKVQDLDYRSLVSDEKARTFVQQYYEQIEYGTRLFLSKMYRGEIEVTHDFYLKRYQLSRPVLPYDYILFDEGQDASPAMLDIFLNQKATKVIVGDTHQQIYAWRHAVNSLESAAYQPYALTTSFRFHQHIAHLATRVLEWKNHLQPTPPVALTGNGKPVPVKQQATLARSNLGLLLRAITYMTDHPNVEKLYFEGNLHSYTYADDGASLYDVLHLYNQNTASIRDRLIRSMNSLDELEEYIEKTEDVQLSMMVEIVKEYGNEIPSLIKALKSKHVADAEKHQAEMIFSTVHRAKGMEYDAVHLVEDFVTEARLQKLKAEAEDGRQELNHTKWNEEINLLYVAITRTRGRLHIPEALLPGNIPASPHIRVVPSAKNAAEKAASRTFSSAKSKPDAPRREPKEKAYDYQQKRLAHKNAYLPWTPECDSALHEAFTAGATLTQLAAQFSRNRGAILSRLKKLGLWAQGRGMDL